MVNYSPPDPSDTTSQNNTINTTRRVSLWHCITATSGTGNTVVGINIPTSIYDNSYQRIIITQRLNRVYTNRYRNDIMVNELVATRLDMGDEMKLMKRWSHQQAPPLITME